MRSSFSASDFCLTTPDDAGSFTGIESFSSADTKSRNSSNNNNNNQPSATTRREGRRRNRNNNQRPIAIDWPVIEMRLTAEIP